MTAEGTPKSPVTFGPPVALPWIRVAAATSGTALAVALVWIFVAPLWGWAGWPIAVRALIAVVPIGLLGWLLSFPWKPRPIIDWTTAWLVGTVVRLLLTPAAAAAVYFSAPCEATQLVAAVGGCYFASLLAEVGTVASALRDRDAAPA